MIEYAPFIGKPGLATNAARNAAIQWIMCWHIWLRRRRRHVGYAPCPRTLNCMASIACYASKMAFLDLDHYDAKRRYHINITFRHASSQRSTDGSRLPSITCFWFSATSCIRCQCADRLCVCVFVCSFANHQHTNCGRCAMCQFPRGAATSAQMKRKQPVLKSQ